MRKFNQYASISDFEAYFEDILQERYSKLEVKEIMDKRDKIKLIKTRVEEKRVELINIDEINDFIEKTESDIFINSMNELLKEYYDNHEFDNYNMLVFFLISNFNQYTSKFIFSDVEEFQKYGVNEKDNGNLDYPGQNAKIYIPEGEK